MNLLQLKKDLIAEEAKIPYAYQDSKGLWTIGVGHLIDKSRGGKLSDRIIDLILEEDIIDRIEALQKVFPWIHNLSEPRQHVLVQMAFQMGTPGLLKFKRTLSAIEDGEFKAAAKFMLQSKWAREDSPNRAKRLAAIMENGE